MFDLKVLIVALVTPLIAGVGLHIFLRSLDRTSVSGAIVRLVFVQHLMLAVPIGYVAARFGIDISKYSSGGSGGFIPLPVFMPLMALVFLVDYLIVVAVIYFAIALFAPPQI